MKITWSPASLMDIQSAYEYVAKDNLRAAEELVVTIDAAVQQLRRFPKMGREGRAPNSRELVISGTPFFVSYALGEDEIELLAVIHGARQWRH
jgi:toxin ParE1/3/4